VPSLVILRFFTAKSRITVLWKRLDYMSVVVIRKITNYELVSLYPPIGLSVLNHGHDENFASLDCNNLLTGK
jgi:hypothetical protein